MTPPARRPTSLTGATAPKRPSTRSIRSETGPSTTVAGSDPLRPIADALAEGATRLRIPDGAAIVLAVSGGPDSTALLHGAALLASRLEMLRADLKARLH